MNRTPLEADPAPLAHRLARHPERERQGLPPRAGAGPRAGFPSPLSEPESDLP